MIVKRKQPKQPTPTKIIETFFEDIKSARHSPRFQIIITGGVLELLANVLVEHKCNNEKSKKFNYANKLILLNEMALISEVEFELLDTFRELRNVAAHVAQFTFTAEALAPFENLYFFIMPPNHDKKHELERLCCFVVSKLWNAHVDFFNNHFDRIGTLLNNLTGVNIAKQSSINKHPPFNKE